MNTLAYSYPRKYPPNSLHKKTGLLTNCLFLQRAQRNGILPRKNIRFYKESQREWRVSQFSGKAVSPESCTICHVYFNFDNEKWESMESGKETVMTERQVPDWFLVLLCLREPLFVTTTLKQKHHQTKENKPHLLQTAGCKTSGTIVKSLGRVWQKFDFPWHFLDSCLIQCSNHMHFPHSHHFHRVFETINAKGKTKDYNGLLGRTSPVSSVAPLVSHRTSIQSSRLIRTLNNFQIAMIFTSSKIKR